MIRIFFSGMAAFLIALSAQADDSRPLYVEIQEIDENTYALRLKAKFAFV